MALTWETHLLTFFRDPDRLTFLEDRAFRTLGEDFTVREDFVKLLAFMLADFLTRGIFIITGKKIKKFFFIFSFIFII
jgi:hypothetical protein